MSSYDRVRLAVIEQAIADYKAALKKKDRYRICHLEKWFLSPWGEMWSGGHGQVIIEQCRKLSV